MSRAKSPETSEMVHWDTPLPRYLPALAETVTDDGSGITEARLSAATGVRRGYRIDIAPARGLSTNGWRSLNERALTASPFLDPTFFTALAATFGSSRLNVLTVRDNNAAGAVRAVWPFEIADGFIPGFAGVARTFQTPYSPFAMPLVDREDFQDILDTAVEVFTSFSALLVVPGLGLGTRLEIGLRAAARHRTIALADHASRPVLVGGQSFEAYQMAHWSTQRRNSVARQMRRLQRIGTVASVVHGSSTDMDAVARDFLALEAAGWKGQRGTAMAARSDTTALFRTVAAEMGRDGLFELHALTLDGRPLAMMAVFRIGDRAWTWKTAYDPEFARYSPGVILMAEVTRALLDGGVQLADSCSTNETVVADPFWHGETASATMNIALNRSTGQLALAAALAAQRGRQALKRGYHGTRKLLRRNGTGHGVSRAPAMRGG